jgi:hypothetical protein
LRASSPQQSSADLVFARPPPIHERTPRAYAIILDVAGAAHPRANTVICFAGKPRQQGLGFGRGARGEIRTHDLCLRRASLCPVELLVPAQSARPERLDKGTRTDTQAGSTERSVIQPALARSNHDQKLPNSSGRLSISGRASQNDLRSRTPVRSDDQFNL